jgi:hypothetical protein
MKTNFFETKEQYLNFRSAWKVAANDPRRKSTIESHDEYIRDSSYRYTVSKGTGQHRVKGWLKAEYYVLFNILRGKEASSGFTPIKDEQKIISSRNDPYDAYNCAVYTINSMRTQSKLITGKQAEAAWFLKQSDEYKNKHQVARLASVSKFLEVFGGDVTVEQLSNLDEVSYKKKGA